MASETGHAKATAGSEGNPRKAHYAVVGAVCALVIGVYAWSAKSGCWEAAGRDAGNSYYNLLAQGFHAGQLSVKREVPAGLAQLADPYDPEANGGYLMQDSRPLYDLSYYRGKLYLYFGVTPGLVLFWPYHGLTSHYLLHRDAVLWFCVAGFLASVGLLWSAWRRYFAETGIGVVAVCALALGLASGPLLLLAPSDVYEVAISCGYALFLLCLVAIWQALHATRGRGWWLAGASLAYGLALGARPSLLFGAVILLAPVVMAWRKGERIGGALLAATGPILLLGLGLLLYNYLRFDQPLEFGQRYQLSGNRQAAAQQFSLSYLWINFRVAFLEPARWSGRFPFIQDIAMPTLPMGYNTEHPFGVLSNIPLVWLALAASLAWRSRRAEARSTLRGFLAAVTVYFGMNALVICLHNSMNIRYEVDFLPALMLLAVLGILGLDRAVAGRRAWQRATRCGWGMLLAISAGFNLFAAYGLYADTHVVLGVGSPGTELEFAL